MTVQELIDTLMQCVMNAEIRPDALVLTSDAHRVYIKCDHDVNIVFITDVNPYGREDETL